MKLSTQADVDAAEKVLKLSWIIVFGVILFSVFTVTPLVEQSTPDGWKWSAWILPLVVDVAVVISIRVDAIVARMGGSTSGWPVVLRILTGGASVLLNVGGSALKGDWVGAAVHTAAPAVLIVVAEASLKWRREIAAASARIEAERREQAEERKREQREREDRARAEREAERQAREAREQAARDAEREAREQAAAEREREREHAARVERETREHAARIAREERAAEAEREALRLKAAADQRREEAARTERKEREERERADREREAKKLKESVLQAQRAAVRKPVAAAAVSTPRPTVSAAVSTPAHESAHKAAQAAAEDDKMSEADARKAVALAVREGRSQRSVAKLTGWSTGWVAARFKELEVPAGQMEMSGI
ncbi:hypothetical protein [Streptomyces sp. NPDC006863]|uniref:hypothetical protein n=1 Tax=Streptomyces sp. NPDC006863 TaxID=3154779 RepID=UPI003406B4A0